MAKPELEFHYPEGAWQDAGAPGMRELVVARDADTGDYSRLVRFEPGTDTSPLGVLAHDFWEEIYIVHGDLTDLRLGQTFHGGFYACRPPGMPHGPWRSANGVLMFETRYGLKR